MTADVTVKIYTINILYNLTMAMPYRLNNEPPPERRIFLKEKRKKNYGDFLLYASFSQTVICYSMSLSIR